MLSGYTLTYIIGHDLPVVGLPLVVRDLLQRRVNVDNSSTLGRVNSKNKIPRGLKFQFPIEMVGIMIRGH